MDAINIFTSFFIGVAATYVLCRMLNKASHSNKYNNMVTDISPNAVHAVLADEITTIKKGLQSNNWYIRGDISKFEGAEKAIITNINHIIDTIFGYMNSTPAVITVFDKNLHVMWLNDLCEEQGFKVGKKVSEIAPGEATATVEKNATHTIKAKHRHNLQGYLPSMVKSA